MSKRIMVQGTMSGAGKSTVAAGLCRVFHQDGLSVAPFKSQNMALNSFITADGLEMGRAQVVQAQAAGALPSVLMNPILLKPCSDRCSQVIVMGEVVGTMDAAEYYKYRPCTRPAILEAYKKLAAENEVVVIEGAGSPAEINLSEGDLVNMGMAEMADAPVLLVADIDRGGVFAQIYGTIMLLPPGQRARIKGVIINKFRGDVDILRPGIDMIEELTGVPVLGVLPMLNIDIDEEDSLSSSPEIGERPIDIAVIRFPRISNATDFAPLARHEAISLRYVRKPSELGSPDMIILPGTKSTMADLMWMRQNGLESLVKKAAERGLPILGICGGYQMLGESLSDPEHTETGASLRGLGLLPLRTVFSTEKTRLQSAGRVCALPGEFAPLSGTRLEAYQIHMGESSLLSSAAPFAELCGGEYDGAVCGNVTGTYLHGLFDGALADALANMLLEKNGLSLLSAASVNAAEFRETQFELLAKALRDNLNVEKIYRIMELQE